LTGFTEEFSVKQAIISPSPSEPNATIKSAPTSGINEYIFIFRFFPTEGKKSTLARNSAIVIIEITSEAIITYRPFYINIQLDNYTAFMPLCQEKKTGFVKKRAHLFTHFVISSTVREKASDAVLYNRQSYRNFHHRASTPQSTE
jgi:hypothetical protein